MLCSIGGACWRICSHRLALVRASNVSDSAKLSFHLSSYATVVHQVYKSNWFVGNAGKAVATTHSRLSTEEATDPNN